MPANRHSREITEQQLQQKASARAVASFVLGILSVVLCGIPIMLVAAVVGLMTEKESERFGYHRFQAPARILCIIGIVLCSLAIIGLLLGFFVLGVLSR